MRYVAFTNHTRRVAVNLIFEGHGQTYQRLVLMSDVGTSCYAGIHSNALSFTKGSVMQFLVFIGSVRNTTPPEPARLGARVAAACRRLLSAGGHGAELIDPLAFDLGGSFKPHFSYAKDRAPEALNRLADSIRSADGYVMVSPEYNHSMSPALAHLLNHFGSSLFAWKPSAIITYSAGQWGGARAAMGMRGFLSELGCLPVSAMVHIPRAQDALDEEGQWQNDSERWDDYAGRTLTQLEWWAEAARHQRADGEVAITGSFTKDPSQRNAP